MQTTPELTWPEQPSTEKTNPQLRKLEFTFIGLSVLLGFCRVWAGRNALMDIDGVSYIDIGKAYLRGDWNLAVNPYWSPLYSWLVGAGLKILRPSPYWEIPVVQLINFLIYLVTLICFRFFLDGLIQYHHHRRQREKYQRMGFMLIQKSVWIAVGYTAFMVCTLEMIQVTNMRPVMCVAAFFFLASGIILRIHTSRPSWKIYLLLGVCLGFGYLAKAALFPLSFTFILASFLPEGGIRKGLFHAAVVLVGLGLVAGPYITLLSQRQGHLTFSEAAPLNYLWFVNNVAVVDFMTGNAPRYGKPVHPMRVIFDHPVAFEFASPVPGTYPVNFDASYWWAGAMPHFDLRQQTKRFVIGCTYLFRLVFSEFQEGILAGIVALYLFSPGIRLALRNMAGYWFIFLPPVAGFALYSLVYVQPRYVGSFFAVFWMGMVSGLCLPDLPASRKVLTSITIAAVMVTLLAVFRSTVSDVRAQLKTGPAEWRVANYLRQIGIQPGDHVGRLHLGYNLGWAVLAQVRVTSEVDLDPDRMEEYLTATDQVKTEVLGAMFRTGVKAIVADHQEGTGCETGWRSVEKTGYYVCTAPGASLRSELSP